MRINQEILWCIDEDYKIYGDYNAEQASNLMVAFDRCNAKQRDDCVTSDKFNEDLEYSYV